MRTPASQQAVNQAIPAHFKWGGFSARDDQNKIIREQMVARKNDIRGHLFVQLLKEKEPARGHGSSFMIHPCFAQSSSTLEKPFQCGEAVFSELAFCFIGKR
ncbi:MULTISPECIES: hypothetical protein [Anoxybacillaceae]|nr:MULTISPECIES: hypothetical protein [Geobacillus]MCG6795564.1 hypothetical protein [Geobacillus sp. YHL]